MWYVCMCMPEYMSFNFTHCLHFEVTCSQLIKFSPNAVKIFNYNFQTNGTFCLITCEFHLHAVKSLENTR